MEININEQGEPIIKIVYSSSNYRVEGKLLKLFLDKGIEKGVELVRIKGAADITNNYSYDEYEIRVKNEKE